MIQILSVILRVRVLLGTWGLGLMFLVAELVQLGEGGRVADGVPVFLLAALFLSLALGMTRRALERLHVEELMQASREVRRREVGPERGAETAPDARTVSK